VTFIRDRDLRSRAAATSASTPAAAFKRVTADLLRRVEITMNDLPVRAYELAYTTGAFNKTLLNSITEFGADNQPFTSQTSATTTTFRIRPGSTRRSPRSAGLAGRQPAQRGGGRGRLGRRQAGRDNATPAPARAATSTSG